MSVSSNEKIREILAKNLGFEETMREIFGAFQIHRALSMSLDEVKRGECRISVTFYEPMTNIYGTVQGGVLGVVLDSAIWMACLSVLGPGVLSEYFLVTDATPSVEIKFPVSVKKRYQVIARSSGGVESIRGRRVICGDGRILTEEGQEIAIASATQVLKPCG